MASHRLIGKVKQAILINGKAEEGKKGELKKGGQAWCDEICEDSDHGG